MEFNLSLNRDCETPLYRQIIEQVTLMVQNGQLKAGDRLPPERELAAETGIARGTINKAYVELERNKIIEVIQGRGSFISPRQDILGRDRKEQGIQLMDETIEALEKLGFSEREMITLFRIRLSEREKNAIGVRVAAVDCNPEALSIFENQLSYISKISFSRFLLDDVAKWAEPEVILGEYDLILTTSTHFAELSGLLPQIKSRLVQAAVSPSQQTVIDLATIPQEAAVAVLTRSEQFMQIITNSLRDFEIANSECFFQDGKLDYTEILSGKRVLIIPPDLELPKGEGIIAEFQRAGGRVITFDYQIERGSLIYLEGEISRILNAK